MFILNNTLQFPDTDLADADGLLAIGGDLSTERLRLAYQSGIFPWYSDNEPILWWSPDPRFVLYPANLKVSRSMQKLLRHQTFYVTFNTNFNTVITHCAQVKREGQEGTWITKEMMEAYTELHKIGLAKSVEVWDNYSIEAKLVGGSYGIDLGHVFCGESMFSLVPNASKYGFIILVQQLRQENYQLVDCQVHTDHLASLGAQLISRKLFEQILKKQY